MGQTTTEADPFLAQARTSLSKLPGAGEAWVRDLRKRGLDEYARQGWPTTKTEAWKYTSLKDLRKERFSHVAPGAGVSPSQLAAHRFPGLAGARLVFVNGRFDEEVSTLFDVDPRLTVRTIAGALEDEPEALRPHLGRHLALETNPFAALNTASFADGAVVIAPEDVKIETPVHVLHLASPGRDALVTHPRTLVVARPGSELTVVESYGGEGKYLTNAATEIVAEANATVWHYRFDRESTDAFHLGALQLMTDRSATIRSHNVCLGGALVRNDVRATFGGEGGDVLLNGLTLLDGAQHVDNHTRIDHASAHCHSDQLYKTILAGRSRGVFHGRIFVAKGAQKTDAYQHNPNLLLSNEALANSTPQLEIFADDVRCTHGSTTGHLDADQVHYLRARGIDEVTARSLLTFAFAGEVIDQIALVPVRERLRELVLAKLPNGELVRGALS